jgi:hypothetical protein
MVRPIGTGAPSAIASPEPNSPEKLVENTLQQTVPDQQTETISTQDPARSFAKNVLAENAFFGNFRAYQFQAAPDGPSSGSNSTPPAPSNSTGVKSADNTPKIAAPAGSPFGPGKKILMLGDSHTVGPYGSKMKEMIKDTGSDVAVDAKIGAAPKDFTNRMTDLIKKENPDTIVVSLGTNFREGGMTQRQIDIQVERITKAVRDTGSKAKIVWVGPPRLQTDMKDNGASLDSFDKMMEKAMGSKGKYVSSNAYTNYEGRDGVHYNKKPAEAWAKGVFDVINSGK